MLQKMSARKSRVPGTSTFSLSKRRSSMGHIQKTPVMRFAPTYRLEPTTPFNSEIAENIIQNVMNHFLSGFNYNPKTAPNLCKGISEEIKSRIKLQKQDRYKLICVVTIGEKRMQGFNAALGFLWDATKDRYVSYVYDRPNLFAIGTVYALYYD